MGVRFWEDWGLLGGFGYEVVSRVRSFMCFLNFLLEYFRVDWRRGKCAENC